MTVILSIAFALFAGLMMTRLVKRLHLPDVTAYLVAGLLIGPFFLGRLQIPGIGFGSYEELESLEIISDIALGFIAFSIGNEFRLSARCNIPGARRSSSAWYRRWWRRCWLTPR